MEESSNITFKEYQSYLLWHKKHGSISAMYVGQKDDEHLFLAGKVVPRLYKSSLNITLRAETFIEVEYFYRFKGQEVEFARQFMNSKNKKTGIKGLIEKLTSSFG